MEELYRAYLSFLRSMTQGLETLTDLNEKKFDAARTDDLMALNELLNQEQAQSLHFRGLEQTRDKLLPKLGLEGVPLSQVADQFPPALQEEARQTVAQLQNRYAVYQAASKKTRTLLERTLQEVETAIVEMGGPPAGKEDGPGYRRETETAAPPPSMKTDFRA